MTIQEFKELLKFYPAEADIGVCTHEGVYCPVIGLRLHWPRRESHADPFTRGIKMIVMDIGQPIGET